MKFFVPHAKDDAEAEHTSAAIKTFAVKTLGWGSTARRIFRIEYTHDRI